MRNNLGGRPYQPLARLDRANPVLDKIFLRLVTADPYMTIRLLPGADRRPKGEYGQCAPVLSGSSSADVLPPKPVSARLVAPPFGIPVKLVVVPDGADLPVVGMGIDVKVEPNVRVLLGPAVSESGKMPNRNSLRDIWSRPDACCWPACHLPARRFTYQTNSGPLYSSSQSDNITRRHAHCPPDLPRNR